MRPQWDNQIDQFAAAIGQIKAALPSLPPVFNTAQGLPYPTEEFIASLESLWVAMKSINDSSEVDPLMLGIHQGAFLPSIAQIAGLAAALTSNPNPALLDQIAQQTWNIRASIVWMLPKRPTLDHIESAISNADFSSKLEILRTVIDEYPNRLKQLTDVATLAQQQLDLITAAADQIKGYERESSTAKTNAEASAAVTISSKDLAATQLVSLTEGIEKKDQLLKDIDALKEKATSTLESTSKVALATSFSKRKEKLSKEQTFWQGAFAVGIIAMCSVGVSSVLGWLPLPPLVINNQIELGPILTRFALIGPIVWFTWFSVRSLSNTNRLIEDYAFKEASALAFVGYQREMQDDAEMIKLLRESAIQNFGNQPTRIFEKSDPASPMHDLFAKALDTGGIDKVLELIKALRSGK